VKREYVRPQKSANKDSGNESLRHFWNLVVTGKKHGSLPEKEELEFTDSR
jgi:hypothetical protein